uniref:F-box domain-containing protein n=1 Tax=Scleropages formosus TaxID=113540 RepID=A0A8C9TPK3_SCLFO
CVLLETRQHQGTVGFSHPHIHYSVSSAFVHASIINATFFKYVAQWCGGRTEGCPSGCCVPPQLALYVLSFLEPKDLLQAAQTCRYWRILAEDNLLWREKLVCLLPCSWSPSTTVLILPCYIH